MGPCGSGQLGGNPEAFLTGGHGGKTKKRLVDDVVARRVSAHGECLTKLQGGRGELVKEQAGEPLIAADQVNQVQVPEQLSGVKSLIKPHKRVLVTSLGDREEVVPSVVEVRGGGPVMVS